MELLSDGTESYPMKTIYFSRYQCEQCGYEIDSEQKINPFNKKIRDKIVCDDCFNKAVEEIKKFRKENEIRLKREIKFMKEQKEKHKNAFPLSKTPDFIFDILKDIFNLIRKDRYIFWEEFLLDRGFAGDGEIEYWKNLKIK